MSLRAALALTSLTAALLASDAPLSARLSSGAKPTVELRNTGNQTVTAWRFAVSSPNQSGGVHREFHSADVYLSEVTRGLPRAPNHLDWLRAGESRTIPVDAAPSNATVEIIAVVFEDGGTWGDAKTIKEFFDQRASERDALGKVVAIFDAVLPQQKGVAALDELQRRFSQAEGGQESQPRRSAREAVETYLQKAKSGDPEDTDKAIRIYADFVRKQHQLAIKHAQPKT
jgi:hypothetical protein